MTKFGSDYAANRGLKSQGETAKREYHPVRLFSDIEFFCKRDKDNKPLKEFSERVWRDTLAECEGQHLIVCIEKATNWMREFFEGQPKNGRFEFFNVKYTNAAETTLRLRARLEEMGMQFRPIRNTRSVSFLNIHKFIHTGDFMTFGLDDHATVNVKVDKELTFQDLAAQRRSNAWP